MKITALSENIVYSYSSTNDSKSCLIYVKVINQCDFYPHVVLQQVKTVIVEKKSNEILNRLNKTKEEASPDFRALREERDKKQRLEEKRKMQKQVSY